LSGDSICFCFTGLLFLALFCHPVVLPDLENSFIFKLFRKYGRGELGFTSHAQSAGYAQQVTGVDGRMAGIVQSGNVSHPLLADHYLLRRLTRRDYPDR
jgi:hypothetical protein